MARQYLPELFVSEFDQLKKKAYELAAHLVADVVCRQRSAPWTRRVRSRCSSKPWTLFPFIQYIYVIDQDGRKITRNITHIVDRAKYETAKIGEDLSDRPWFIEPMKDGKVHVTDFYSSRYTGALCITVCVPIRNEAEEIVGILGHRHSLRRPGQDGAKRGDLGALGLLVA